MEHSPKTEGPQDRRVPGQKGPGQKGPRIGAFPSEVTQEDSEK